MSRKGRIPIDIPALVQVVLDGNVVKVKGPKGELQHAFSSKVSFEIKDKQVFVNRKSNSPTDRAMHGTARVLVANMIKGVEFGFEEILDLVGVGYRAQAKGKGFSITLGYSHPIEIHAPDGIQFKVEETRITISGSDKQKIGQIAAEIRSLRPPEPYKGKGVKYAKEVIIRKAGKSAATAGK